MSRKSRKKRRRKNRNKYKGWDKRIATPSVCVKTYQELENGKPGTIHFATFLGSDEIASAFIKCPGCGDKVVLEFNKTGWTWNKDKENPSLRPSIKHQFGCGWHGWLTDGKFLSDPVTPPVKPIPTDAELMEAWLL